MISLKNLDKEAIARLNDDFVRRVEAGEVRQMRLKNIGKHVLFSIEGYRKAAELALKA
ncbi:MAG: hypothetical protein LBC85_05960 [Fibromonadaceae bacterium]|jgi:hypothetical protein|nr:hypothetical protein [Fibromonadaceae bacterium]